MRGFNTHQVSSFDSAFGDLRRLKEFADRLKAPPIPKLNKEDLPKKGSANDEAPNFFNLQDKDNKGSSIPQAPESDIIRYLSKESTTSFTTKGIIQIAEMFGTTEYHIRLLISSLVTDKYGG